ncbi:MAG: prepilin-type N-terminal cleavage/methylation domain-containing protein [Alicyclobacillaceae bacterium]|nr:prepilin-type N-terminal cleavage/methylation domain-containing protein [Alicyclobacillaceae bacterium]
MANHSKAQSGMTLVEVMAALTILVLALGGISLLLGHLIRSWYQVSEKTQIQSSADLILRQISRDLTYSDNQDNVVKVTIDPTGLTLNIGIGPIGSDGSQIDRQITYQVFQDPSTRRTVLSRTDGSRSILVGSTDCDYAGSYFATDAMPDRVKVHLKVTGPRGSIHEVEGSLKFRFAQ